MIYQIAEMKKENIPQAMTIWHSQFARYLGHGPFPHFWDGGKGTIESYLKEQIEKCSALTAKIGNELVGYMAWMCFDFHGERTAFCPIVAHAALVENESGIYQALYTASSRKWVQDNRFNHLWMMFYDDTCLRDMLYDVGFASYVIDACQKASPNVLETNCRYKIMRADPGDADELLELENESRHYLSDSPIFLRQEEYSRDQVLQAISRNGVFVAWDDGRPIGVMSVNVDQGYHFERLTTTDSGYIERLGAFVRPEYRGRGVGTGLLRAIFEYCGETGKPFVHASFESANPYAIRFWPKYLKPAIRSVRRSVNKDANGA